MFLFLYEGDISELYLLFYFIFIIIVSKHNGKKRLTLLTGAHFLLDNTFISQYYEIHRFVKKTKSLHWNWKGV